MLRIGRHRCHTVPWPSLSPFMVMLAVLWLAASSEPAAARESSPAIVATYFEADEPALGDLAHVIIGVEQSAEGAAYPVSRLAFNTPFHIAQRSDAARLEDAIAVIYPDIGEPFRSIFAKIIEGIEDKIRNRVATFAVGADFNSERLASELRRRNIRVVIALGRHGLKAASSLDPTIGVIVGCVVSVPESERRSVAVYSLAPDPALLFERLKSLAPATKRVFVVYNTRENAWLIKLARDTARAQGLELVAQEAQDAKSALQLYQEILASADPKTDALWLPQDSVVVDETAVLPLLLQEAWNRKLTIFSSSVAHVRRGALFSLYPDNAGLGRNLATTALAYLGSGGQTHGMVPLREVLMAVNVRTASHLGLGLVAKRQSFDMVFPEQ